MSDEPIYRIWKELKHVSIHKHGICLWGGGKRVFGILRLHATPSRVAWKEVFKEATEWAVASKPKCVICGGSGTILHPGDDTSSGVPYEDNCPRCNKDGEGEQ